MDSVLFVKSSDSVGNVQEEVKDLLSGILNDVELANLMANVDKRVAALNLRVISKDLIRELVRASMEELGYDSNILKKEGFYIKELSEIIEKPKRYYERVKKERSYKFISTPAGMSDLIGRKLKESYALEVVYPQKLSSLHLEGDIHIHDVDEVDKLYWLSYSLDNLKKTGISSSIFYNASGPARHPEVLVDHVVKFSSAVKQYFTAPIYWYAFNVLFAPFVKGLSYEEVRQIIQMLVFGSANTFAVGEVLEVIFGLYWGVPSRLREIEAIGFGGSEVGKYADFSEEAKLIFKAFMDVIGEGDKTGVPFFFPRVLFIVTEDTFSSSGWEEALEMASKVAFEKGGVDIIFDREFKRLSPFYKEKGGVLDRKDVLKTRLSLLNVSLNLPRLAYKTPTEEKAFDMLGNLLEKAAEICLAKREFIERLNLTGESGSYAAFRGLIPFDLSNDKVVCSLSFVGLSEFVKFIRGEEYFESTSSLKFALKVVAALKLKCEELSSRYGIEFVLEQSPQEEAVFRLAYKDLKQFAGALKVVRGNKDLGMVYYTSSSHLPVDADLDLTSRAKLEGKFHLLMDGVTNFYVYLAENSRLKDRVASFVRSIWSTTSVEEMVFVPEFTVCYSCGNSSRGLKSSCPVCGSLNVDGVSKAAMSFSKVSWWNSGKVAEISDRKKF